jgi:histone demethylase JARID1
VTKDWFDYGFKCQDIYRKSREKIPVFPIDWLIIQNVLNIDKLKMDQASLLKLKDVYSKIYKEEKKSREQLKLLIKEEYLSQKDSQFPQAFQAMQDRENVAEDTHQCKFCTDFAYLSLVHCTVHNYDYCIQHKLLCGCKGTDVKVIYRYSNAEMDRMLKDVTDASLKPDQEPATEQKKIRRTNFKVREELKIFDEDV